MKKKYCLLIFLVFLFCLTISTTALALNNQNSYIIVLAPGLSLDDLSQSPNLKKLTAGSALGLMNSTSRGKQLAGSYLTLGAGQNLYCPPAGLLGLQVSETYNGSLTPELYERDSSLPANNHQILLPHYYSLFHANPQPSPMGLLAEHLERAKIPLLLLGNHDLPEGISRPGVLMAMDGSGKVSEGCVDYRTYVVDPASPTVYVTDYSFLYERTRDFLSRSSGVVLLDLGDLSRLDRFYEKLSPDTYAFHRRRLLDKLNDFLLRLSDLTAEKKNCCLLFIAPYPGKIDLLQGNFLTPVLYMGGDTAPGLLSSPSTKRAGLITNLDITPSILELLEITPTSFIPGKPFRVLTRPDALNFLIREHKIILANYLQRPPVLKGYVLIQIISVFAFLALFFIHHPALLFLRPVLLALISGPLLFLLVPLLPRSDLFTRLAFILTAALLTVYLLTRHLSILERLAFICLGTAGLVITDVLLGAPLMKKSLLGYDPISGARYYGLGNEYMGVLLGSLLMGFSMLLQILHKRRPTDISFFKFLFSLLLFPAVILVAAPQWGTNAGGSITFFLASSSILAFFYGKRLYRRNLIFLGISALICFALLFVYDSSRPLEVQSHIGLTARLIAREGPLSLLPIMQRKIMMNLKLIQYSSWSRVFLTFLGALALLSYKPVGSIRRLFHTYPFLRKGCLSALAGAFAALLFNDSGIVAAATAMIYIALPLLYLLIAQEK